MPATTEMTGLRKTAILLVGMGREASAKVLAQMKDTEVEEITAEIMRLRDVEPEESEAVLGEFHELVQAKGMVMQGGLSFARDLLEASLGAERAGEIMGRLSAAFMEMPFQFLHKTDPRQLLSFVQDEHPQIIALVLAHMSADKATAVLSGLAPELQADVAHRIAVMDRTTPDIIKAVEMQLERKLSLVLQSTETSTVGGLQPLVDIINRADRATERLILEGLEAKDAALAEEVRSRMFMFEDIVGLDDKSIQLVLRSVETNDLATALKGVSDAVRQKIMRNLSERAAENLADEIEMMGPVRLRTVEEAQAKVVQGIRALEETGQIVMRRGGDDEFVS
ncbi:MAG: flagellar motor switch protein FliG [Actinomycetota bacterium]|nr:flagellar motor switch protein FliG [Actinomycetota bacterium]